MMRKTIYKLPVIEKSVVLEAKLPAAFQRGKKVEAEERQKQLEDVSRESYKRGWDDAEEEMQGKVVEENDALFKGLKKAVEELRNEINNIWGNCEKEIIHLSLAIAKKITCAEISKNSREITERVVAEAVGKVKGKKIASISMSAKDLEGFELKKISDINALEAGCEIVADDDVSPGGCMVVTDYGAVNAEIESRWDEIVSTLAVDNNSGYKKNEKRRENS